MLYKSARVTTLNRLNRFYFNYLTHGHFGTLSSKLISFNTYFFHGHFGTPFTGTLVRFPELLTGTLVHKPIVFNSYSSTR